MKPDLWDVAALVGAGLVGCGVWQIAGAPWALILWGGLLLAGPVVRAVAHSMRAKGDS